MIQPAIGFIETNSIAKGIEASDAMMKVANVELIDAYAICPGKYLVFITGPLADVHPSVDLGAETAGVTLIDKFVIPNVNQQIVPAILGTSKVENFEAVGIIETFTVASCIRASDAAAKAAKISLIEIRLAKGLGGKSFVTLCSDDVGAVRSAVNAGCELIKDEGVLISRVVIPKAHQELRRTLL
ncbi:MAG TPA: propanediol utilization protein [Elusimicrobia bacterium]|nr:propanediol utilization protein [Elusimicrobiota bacterium]